MALVNMRDLIYHAYSNRYAICSFDLANIDCLYAILAAAEQCRSPVILNICDGQFDPRQITSFMAAVEHAAHCAQIPVAIQCENINSLDAMQKGIKYGCNGVMCNASRLPLPANIEKTREIAMTSHQCGIAVEGKLGNVHNGDTDTGQSDPANNSPSVHEAIAFVERTRIDFLAVNIGVGNDRRKARSKLDYQRLARINQAVHIPLVLEGYRELSDDQYFKLISHGVAKIDYTMTMLNEAQSEEIKQALKSTTAVGDDYSLALRVSVEKKALHYMHLCGSAGRAAEVMMQCRAWTNIEHLIVYNTNHSDESDIHTMITEGTRELAKIPGVRAVIAGKSINDNSKYAYTWLIRFCSREVVEYYKEHPVHKSFADHYFRPSARDRITSDYELLSYHEGTRNDQEYIRATG